MTRKIQSDDRDIFYAALAMIFDQAGINLKQSHAFHEDDNYERLIAKTASDSGCRVRKLRLKGEWWKTDNGTLLGFYKGYPCVLIPKERGYRLVSIKFGIDQIINETIPELHSSVFYFYPAFRRHFNRIYLLFAVALPAIKKDLFFVIGIFFLAAALNLFFPFGMGLLIEEAVAHSDFPVFFQIVAGLFAITISIILFNISEFFLTIRIRYKMQLNISPAVWDRVLRLPMSFFKHYSDGDILIRASALRVLQEYVSYTTIVSFLNGLFASLSLFILFYFSMTVGITTFIATVIISLIVFWMNVLNLKYNYKIFPYKGKLTQLVLQMILGLEKLKATASEHKIFQKWQTIFNEKLNIEAKSLKMGMYLAIFTETVEIMSMGLLIMFSFLMGSQMSVLKFVVISSAFNYFLYGILGAFRAFSEIIEIAPYFKMALPILETQTEDEIPKNSPGVLKGHIKLDQVSFRYQREQSPVLNNICLEIQPGECVAIVGESGSGKSTLLKLLLGFIAPEEGRLTYDEIDLSHLNIKEVRSQIGSVIQEAKLFPGTIFDNISGGQTDFSREEAMKIVSELGFEAMIRDLPMGLDTLVGEGLGTFSGGEKQLIQLASLIGKKPRIVFLDEATSALDNAIQHRVYEFLTSYKSTQLVIAHRLSTIRYADKIFVMDKGRIVEQGNYEELSEKGVYFKALLNAERL